MPERVIFFDLWGTLLRAGERGVELAPGADALLAGRRAARLGVLANAGAGRTARDVRRALEFVGIDARFERELVVAASDLPTPLPDRRAFAVAAALAEVAIGDCTYVSRDPAMVDAARDAGMHVAPATAARAAAAGPVDLGAAGASALAGEVDEDTGPTFVLEGRVVTMDDGAAGVIERGRVVVSKGKIALVGERSAPLPAQFDDAVRVDTRGTIYPGLMDLHNHFAYNVLPLWVVPRRSDGTPYVNRAQWPRHKDYKPLVTEPIALMAGFSPTAEAIVRYVEAKAMVGGTTTGQGIRGKRGVRTTLEMYRGAMRNVEETNDARLPEAGTQVPNLKANDPEEVEGFRRALASRAAYFYHLSEGVGTEARSHFLKLRANRLLKPSLVGIHALGLERADLEALGDARAKVVWSPYSNQLLYDRAIDLAALRDSGAVFSIGCDWAPTGSKNLLFEMKVARYMARTQPGAGLTSADLVRAVTRDAARVVGWGEHLGRLRAGALADLVVIAGRGGDPYDHLIDATEADVALVVIHGVPRYGDATLFTRVHADPGHPPEKLKIGGKQKLVHTFTPGSQINHVSLAAARTRLEEAMGDLPAFRQRVQGANEHLRAFAVEDEGFTLVLDNEFDEEAEDPTAVAAAAARSAQPVTLPDEIELDALEVGAGTYWDRVRAQRNLPDELKDELEQAY